MTREEKISRLKDILSEINENDNAVCYLTSEDNELIESAIKALEQEPCEDAISRKAVTDTSICEGISCNECSFGKDFEYGFSECQLKKRVDALPSVQPKPKTGHWIEVAKYSDGKHEIKCSECRSHIIDRGHANSCVVKEKYKYCPRCGARMVELQESEE